MKKIWTTAKADREFSHWIRDRDNGLCFKCGKRGSQNSHFWGRVHSATRYSPANCDYVCGGCHFRIEHDKQGWYREFKIKQLGQKEYDALRKLAFSTVPRRESIKACMALLEK